MAKRDISVALWIALFGLGGAALIAGLSLADPLRSWTVVAGLSVVAVAGVALWKLFKTAPKSAAAIAIEDREFLDPSITAEKLIEMVEDRTTVQREAIAKPYIGKWMHCIGRVSDVTPIYGNKWLLHARASNNEYKMLFNALFGPEAFDQLRGARPGDLVEVVGKLSSVNYAPTLDPAEIRHLGPPPKAKPKPKPKPKPKVSEQSSARAAPRPRSKVNS